MNATSAKGAKTARGLLSAGAIQGKAIALSVSDSDDLPVLGLLQSHLQLAVAEIARMVYVAHARLLYGGDLRRGGHTELLLHELTRYARKSNALSLFLAWNVHRRTPIGSLEATDQQLGLRGQIVALDIDGRPLADWRSGRPEAGLDDLSAQQKEASFDAMRARMCDEEHARVAIGGRRRAGDTMPGILQEVLYSLERQHPVFLAGGFGGTTLDSAIALDPACEALKSPMSGAIAPRAVQALEALRRTAAAGSGWSLLNNGLDVAENRRLAATHRPSEMAALVATGLGRVSRGQAGLPADSG